jgi:hypothetical protein
VDLAEKDYRYKQAGLQGSAFPGKPNNIKIILAGKTAGCLHSHQRNIIVNHVGCWGLPQPEF